MDVVLVEVVLGAVKVEAMVVVVAVGIASVLAR